MEHYVKKLRSLFIPTHIQIELTKICNWKCKFCYAECDGQMGMDQNRIIKLLDELKKEGTLEINFTGGEPLMRKDCFEIFEYARSLGFALVLNTNGSLINEGNFDKIMNLFGRLEVSLHSSKSQIHDDIVQVQGAWNNTMHALSLFKKCPEKVLVKCVLTADELHDIDNMKAMIRELGFDFNIDFNITPTYSGDRTPLELGLSDSEIKELIQKDRSYIYRLKIDDIKERYEIKKMSDGICRAGRNLAFIDADGYVYPCITFKSSALTYNQKNLFQNINCDSFHDIWHENGLLRQIRTLEATNFQQCTSCKYDYYCKKCIGVNFKETGELVCPSESYCVHSDNMFSFLLNPDINKR